MPLPYHLYENGQALRVVSTPADLGAGGAEGQVALTLDPLGFYAWTLADGWIALASLEGATVPALGNHNLFSISHPDVDASDTPAAGEILTYDGNTWKSGPPVPAATETTPGKVELATTTETSAGTETTRAVHPAGLKSALTPEAWIAPTLLAGWVNYGAPYDNAGYRKEPTGLVRLRGVIKNGTIANGTVLFNLPVGYRPSAQRSIPSYQGGADDAIRLEVATNGDVSATGLANNFNLLLDGVVFVR
jgi:hypothetical protein